MSASFVPSTAAEVVFLVGGAAADSNGLALALGLGADSVGLGFVAAADSVGFKSSHGTLATI